MPLDGITAKCLAAELNIQLADARLDRIYQPDRHDILLQLRSGNDNKRLILSVNPSAPRLHLTSESRENPSEPPMFCMLLRKHLAGARLIDITTPGFERIFQFRFLTVNELGDRLEKTLVVEIMGRHSNIILLNHENRIHDAILHIDESISRVREIMPARLYVLPPDQKKLPPDTARELLDSGQSVWGPATQLLNLEKALLDTLQGFSPQLCHEAVFLANLDPRLKLAQLDPEQNSRFNLALSRLLDTIISGQFSPSIFFEHPAQTIPIDFHALNLHDYAYQRPAESISQAMDLFYLERNRQNTFKQKRQALEKIVNNQLDHYRKKLEIHEADQAEGRHFEQHRRFGELILANMHLAETGQASLAVIDYYQDGQPEIQIPLQGNLTASQNAQRYFKLYAKAHARFDSGSRLAIIDRQDIAYLETLQNALSAATEPDDLLAVRQEIATSGFLNEMQFIRAGFDQIPGIQDSLDKNSSFFTRNQKKPEPQLPGKPGKKSRRYLKAAQERSQHQRKAAGKGSGKGKANPAPLPPRSYLSSDGFTILVGRNNLQNDQLTLKTAQKDDLWLHVQKIPGTHVIIRSNSQPVPDRTLLEAAQIAAWFSRAAMALPENKSGSNLKVAVDYCPVSHVRKPAGARPGMVVYDRYQTMLVSPADPQVLSGSSL